MLNYISLLIQLLANIQLVNNRYHMLFHLALSLFVITNLKVLDFSVRIISMQLFHHIHDKQFSIPRSKGPMLDILIEFFTYIMQFQSHHPTQYSFLLESVSMISQDPLTSSSRTSVFKLLETTSARSAEVLQGWYPLTSLTFNIKTILRLFTDCFFEI